MTRALLDDGQALRASSEENDSRRAPNEASFSFRPERSCGMMLARLDLIAVAEGASNELVAIHAARRSWRGRR